MRKLIIIAAAFVVAALGIGGYFYVDHRNDVAHAKAHAKQVRHERAVRISRAYQAHLNAWRRDTAAWQIRNSTYLQAKRVIDPVLSAFDDMPNGGSYDEYNDGTQEIQSAYNTAMREASFEAFKVIEDLRKGANNYIDEMNVWREWKEDFNDTRTIDDLDLNRYQSKAEDHESDAVSDLADLEPGPAPVKPGRGGGYSYVPRTHLFDGDTA